MRCRVGSRGGRYGKLRAGLAGCDGYCRRHLSRCVVAGQCHGVSTGRGWSTQCNGRGGRGAASNRGWRHYDGCHRRRIHCQSSRLCNSISRGDCRCCGSADRRGRDLESTSCLSGSHRCRRGNCRCGVAASERHGGSSRGRATQRDGSCRSRSSGNRAWIQRH